jgi:hypothetical protein
VTTQRDGENHEVIPWHHPIKTGTLSSIIKKLAKTLKPALSGRLRFLSTEGQG